MLEQLFGNQLEPVTLCDYMNAQVTGMGIRKSVKFLVDPDVK